MTDTIMLKYDYRHIDGPELQDKIKEFDLVIAEYTRIIGLLNKKKKEVEDAKTEKAKNRVWKTLTGDYIKSQFRKVDELITLGNRNQRDSTEYGKYYYDNHRNDWIPGTEEYLDDAGYNRISFSFENFISYLETYQNFLVKNIKIANGFKERYEGVLAAKLAAAKLAAAKLATEAAASTASAAAEEASTASAAAGGSRKQKRSLCRRTVRRGGKSSKKRNKGRRKMKSKRGVPIRV